MFLSKRKYGIYYIFYEDPDTKIRKSISTKEKSKIEALKFLSNFKDKLESRERNPIKDITLKKFIFFYLKYSEAIHSINTTRTIKTSFNIFLRYVKDVPLTSISSNKIQEYLEFRIRNSSKYQARKDLINLSSAFNKAIVYKYLTNNPCQGIKRIKVPEKQPNFFSEVEFSKLLNVIENEDIKDIVQLAVNTGLRQMELLTLNWDQVNLQQNLLTLDNRNHLTKSNKIRTIPLNNFSNQVLTKRYQTKSGKKVFLFDNWEKHPELFSKAFKKYIFKAEINPKLNFHSLRHTFASWRG